jgi:hypothetical protein
VAITVYETREAKMSDTNPDSDRVAGAEDPNARPRSTSQRGSPTADRNSPRGHFSGVSSLLGQRLRAIDPGLPDRQQTALRLYIASELVREFGDGLLKDPSFSPMVEAVQAEMRQDPQIAAAAEALGRWLVEQHQP